MMATCLELAEAKYPEEFNGKETKSHESISLVPILKGKTVDRDHAYVFNHGGTHAIVKGEYKIVREGRRPWALYHLEEDRTETLNLAAKYPERVTQMAAIWEKRWGKRK